MTKTPFLNEGELVLLLDELLALEGRALAAAHGPLREEALAFIEEERWSAYSLDSPELLRKYLKAFKLPFSEPIESSLRAKTSFKKKPQP